MTKPNSHHRAADSDFVTYYVTKPMGRGETSVMDCRAGCGACCIAPSISTPIPGMPHGKPAGIPCVQLLPDLECALFGRPERPAVCVSLRPSAGMCGANRDEALAGLARLELATRPG